MLATVGAAVLSVVGSVWQSGRRTRKALAAHETRCADDKAAVTKTLKRLDRKLEALGAAMAGPQCCATRPASRGFRPAAALAPLRLWMRCLR